MVIPYSRQVADIGIPEVMVDIHLHVIARRMPRHFAQ
jgi:hypothetical protein